MADPYPAVGSNYRPPIEPSTTNRGLTLTAEQVVALRDILSHIPDPSKEVVELGKIVPDHHQRKDYL